MSDIAVLDAEDLEAKAQHAHELHMAVVQGLQAGRAALWSTAKAMYEFDQESGWTYLGYDTVGEWLADPDISTTSATYYRLIRVYRSLVIERKQKFDDLVRLDASKVAIVLGAIEKGKALSKEALSDVEVMPARDLRRKYITGDPAIADDEALDDESPFGDIDADTPRQASERQCPEIEEFQQICDRAKKRRQNLVKYIQSMTDWELRDGYEGAQRTDWWLPAVNGDIPTITVPEVPEDPFEAALVHWKGLRESLQEGLDSGAPYPRIPRALIEPALPGLDLIVRTAELSLRG
jgi:hypothetical protein